MMLRDYSTGYKDDVQVFSGLEVEHTPAYGKQTLFLARNDLTFDQIQELCEKVNAQLKQYIMAQTEHICTATPCRLHKYINCLTEVTG